MLTKINGMLVFTPRILNKYNHIKCSCLHYNKSALIKQISLFDTALVMT